MLNGDAGGEAMNEPGRVLEPLAGSDERPATFNATTNYGLRNTMRI